MPSRVIPDSRFASPRAVQVDWTGERCVRWNGCLETCERSSGALFCKSVSQPLPLLHCFQPFLITPNHWSHCGYCYQIQHILISSSLIERRYCDSVDSNDSNIDIEIDIDCKLCEWKIFLSLSLRRFLNPFPHRWMWWELLLRLRMKYQYLESVSHGWASAWKWFLKSLCMFSWLPADQQKTIEH